MVTVRFTYFCLHHVLAHTLLFATSQWPFEKTVVPPTTPSAYAWTHVGVVLLHQFMTLVWVCLVMILWSEFPFMVC